MILGYDVRGLYKKEVNESLAYEIGLALSKLGKGDKITVGYDSRTSSTSLHNSLVNGLVDGGCNVITIGMVPNPVCYFYTFHKKMDCGVYITASHLPAEYNGFKFIRKDGTSFTEELSRIKQILDQGDLRKSERSGKHEIDVLAEREYVEYLYPKFQVLGKPVVVVDCMYGASSNLAPRLLEKVGCKVVALRAKALGDFNKIRPEPLPDNLSLLQEEVVKNKALFGVAYDGDADRAIFVDENGNFVYGDKSLAIMAGFKVEKKRGKVVTPVSTSSCVEEYVKAKGGEIVYTKVGAPIVARKMLEINAVFGGEENGGLIFPEHQFCRDGGMATMAMLELLAIKNKKLSELVEKVPKYYLIKTKVKCNNKKEVMEKLKEKIDAKKFDFTDGIKAFFDNGWVLIRPSGTEPIIRIYAEGKSQKDAEKIAEKYKKMVEKVAK